MPEPTRCSACGRVLRLSINGSPEPLIGQPMGAAYLRSVWVNHARNCPRNRRRPDSVAAPSSRVSTEEDA